MRYELSDYEWSVIKPMLPNKPRGVPRVDDRRVLNSIFWVLAADTPEVEDVVRIGNKWAEKLPGHSN